MFITLDPIIIYKSRDNNGNIVPGVDNTGIYNTLIELEKASRNEYLDFFNYCKDIMGLFSNKDIPKQPHCIHRFNL